MAIREVRVGIESTYATPATTFVFMRVNDLAPKNLAPLDKTKETSGTSITFQRGRLKGRQFDFDIKTYGYHDMTCYLMALAFGVPTVATDYLTSVGANRHRFIPGGSAVKSATLQWKQVSSSGVLWFQARGCQVKTVKCTIAANGVLMWQFTGHGKYATQIAPPTVVNDATAAYIQPIDMSQQSTTSNGASWVDPPQTMDITVDNGIAPDWTIQANRDFQRMKIGVTTGNASIDAFFDAYTGSLTDREDNFASAMPGTGIIYTAVDSISTLQSSGPIAHPSTTLTIPRPYVDAVSQDNTDTDVMEKGTLEFAYDTTLASLMSFDFLNQLTAAIYNGTP